MFGCSHWLRGALNLGARNWKALAEKRSLCALMPPPSGCCALRNAERGAGSTCSLSWCEHPYTRCNPKVSSEEAVGRCVSSYVPVGMTRGFIQVVARCPAAVLTFCSPAGCPGEREEEYEGRKRLALPHVVQLRSQVSLNGGWRVPPQIPAAPAAPLTRSATRSPLSRGARVYFPIARLVFGLRLLVSAAARNDRFHPPFPGRAAVAQLEAALPKAGSPGGSSIPGAGEQEGQRVFSFVALSPGPCLPSLANTLP